MERGLQTFVLGECFKEKHGKEALSKAIEEIKKDLEIETRTGYFSKEGLKTTKMEDTFAKIKALERLQRSMGLLQEGVPKGDPLMEHYKEQLKRP